MTGSSLFIFEGGFDMHIETKNKKIDISGLVLLVGVAIVYDTVKAICKEVRKKK